MPSRPSQLPDGGHTPTYGSNLLMDGFDFDSEYGSGPEAARKDPQLPRSTRGLSKIPDGVLVEGSAPLDPRLLEAGDTAGVGDLGGLLTKEAARLVDLSWLEDAVQDPDRLPKDPHNCIPQLEEAWGVHRRTDGRELHPVNRDAPRPAAPRAPFSGLPSGEVVRALVASAMRRSAFGESFERIASDTEAALRPALMATPDDPTLARVARAMRAVRAEHGVAGRLYLREEAFPGLLTGKWTEEIRKKCASARYWLAAPGSKLSAYDRYMGKEVVSEIPWVQALASYEKGASSPVRSASDARSRLIALLRAPAPAPVAKPAREAVEDPSARISSEAARTALAGVERKVQKVAPRTPTAAFEAVRRSLARWSSSGLLTREDATRLAALKVDPPQILRAAVDLVVAAGHPRPVNYDGPGVGKVAAGERPTRDSVWAAAREQELKAEKLRRAREEVTRMAARGQLTRDEASRILSGASSAEEMVRVARARAADLTRPAADLQPVPARAFEGPRYAAAPAGSPRKARDAEAAASAEEALERRRVAAAHEAVGRWVKAGQLTAAEAARITGGGLPPAEMVRMAAARVEQRAGQRKLEARAAAPVTTYGGRQYTAHVPVVKPLKPLAAAPARALPQVTASVAAPSFDPGEFGLTAPLQIEFETAPTSANPRVAGVELGGMSLELSPEEEP